MVKHPENVETYSGTLEQLAEEVSNMRYDRVAYIKSLYKWTEKSRS